MIESSFGSWSKADVTIALETTRKRASGTDAALQAALVKAASQMQGLRGEMPKESAARRKEWLRPA